MTRGLDLAMYLQALPVYARNVGVLLPPLIAALISVGLSYFSAWFFAASGGAGTPFINLIVTIIYGFAFAVSVIFADDAWRHGRASLGAAWNSAQRKAGNILIAVIGFLFLTWVAGIIGSVGGRTLSLALEALAAWAFIYAIPAAAIGGIPGGASLSASLQAARRHPIPTAVLVIVCIVVWIGINNYAVSYLPFRDGAYDIAAVILKAVALGYVALVVAKQYNELAFRAFW